MNHYYRFKPELLSGMKVTLKNGKVLSVKQVEGSFVRCRDGQVYCLRKDKNGYFFD